MGLTHDSQHWRRGWDRTVRDLDVQLPTWRRPEGAMYDHVNQERRDFGRSFSKLKNDIFTESYHILRVREGTTDRQYESIQLRVIPGITRRWYESGFSERG